MNLFQRRPIPNRDMKRERLGIGASEVTIRQMTSEERERLRKIKPYNYDVEWKWSSRCITWKRRK